MTTATIAFSELAEKGADANFIRQTLQHALQRLMEMNAEALCQAAYGERTDERINSRNGYRDRAYETRAGKVGLKIPKPRLLAKRHCSCAFQTHEYAITQKLHLNQQVIRDHRFDLTSSRKSF
ncbi:transposase [Massilia sp. erpn]|uniref:transposase n=1 Tax=Massilia sp. erpn TaxID=2738142 RepID=UPI00210834D2|nr:transposase [Massilia sp. erpn]UTY57395.1 hypothetical protein HPQ68_09435 [Massilia sp. erpn]